MSPRPLRIAIDGPSGAGKSTLARSLATRLGLPYVDTGAIYRAVGWLSLQHDVVDPVRLVAELQGVELRVEPDPVLFRVLIDGADVTQRLREPEVGLRASKLAAAPEVREWLLPLQRDLAVDGVVMEGRDIGTVVLRDADVKFFVTASEGERMRRRTAQLGDDRSDRGAADVRDRDRRDRTRRASPLRPAPDAIEVDTSGDTPAGSLERLLAEVRRRRSPGPPSTESR